MVNNLKIFFLALSVIMVGIVIWTCTQSNLFQLPAAVLNEPWFRTTLIDFYFNIAILSVWVIYKEASLKRSILWVISFIALGSIATAFYVFIQFLALKHGEGIREVLLRREY